jgi:hypothetical protein
MRKMILYTMLLTIASAFLSGCGLDNYDAPRSVLTGKVVYNGQNIGVKGTGSTVQLELWQPGYDLYTAIPVYVTQDGSFQTEIFDGDYKLVAKSGAGPWVSSQDTVKVTVKGATTCEYPVTPFYTISNENLSLNGSTLTATFTVTAVAGTQQLERAILVVNKTSFVDENAQIARADQLAPGTGQITMTLELTEAVLSSTLLNARVGLKTEGNQAIYSSVVKIK